MQKIEIPEFKEVYFKRMMGNPDHPDDLSIKTVCELHSIDTGEVLCFGISKVTGLVHYNKVVGKLLAYANAMRFLFIRYLPEDVIVEDHTDD